MFKSMSKNQKRGLILLLSVIVFSLWYYLPPFTEKLFYKQQPAFANLANITEIDFKLEDYQQKAVLKDGQWQIQINNELYPAETSRINEVVEYLKKLEIKNIASNNADKNKESFQLNKEITLKDSNNKSYTIYIGKISQTGDLYVRIKGQNTIFIAENLNGLLLPSDFRDLNVHLVNENDEPSEIEVKGSNSFVLKKDKDNWTINGKLADKTKVDNFIFDLKNLRAEDIIKKQERNNPILTLIIKAGNQESQFYVYKDQDEFFINNKDYDYKLSSNQVELLNKPAEEFLKQN